MIDRRLRILEGLPIAAEGAGTPSDADATQRRSGSTETTVSALRGQPFVVLLGEPGIGKTTVIEAEAKTGGTRAVKVRELINDPPDDLADTLYIDALDEYRFGTADLDKADQLAKAIRASGALRWRLTCRSEDWQKEADIEAVKRTTGGAPITIAQLLPLDLTETLAVLVALGEPDPDGFVDRAFAMGASGLLESPLSLKLLRQSIIGDRPWPRTRFDLFDQATHALAHEDNKVHRRSRGRSSPSTILAASARASLFLLVTGGRAIWRSEGLPPAGDDRAFLSSHALGFDPQVIDDALGSSLFRGEGESFEPIHRTIAEFLGGRALAEAVIGTTTHAALPLSRAKALITGADGRAPTDLRGLYAWFAAHLARKDAVAQAHELVEADAVSVLVYGDAAAFTTATRRALLASLDQHDPYFRASEVGPIAVGGLAGEDLAADFHAALEHGDGTHRMMTVYEVLSAGQPVLSLRPLLRSIAIDPERPEWQRSRAVAAWLNGAVDANIARRALFDALAPEPPSGPREAIRAELLGGMTAEAVTIADIQSVVSDFARAPDDNTVMRLWGLRQGLVAHPRPELFDVPFDWVPRDGARRHSVDAEGLVDHALAAAIRADPAPDAARLWRWLANTREDKWSNLGEATRPAVAEWLATKSGRDVALFDAVLAADDPAEGPWMIGTYYASVVPNVSGGVIDRLLELADKAKPDRKQRLLAIAVSISRRYAVPEDAYWRLHAFLEARLRGGRRLLKELTLCTFESWRQQQFKRARKQRRVEAAARTSHLTLLRGISAGLAQGINKKALAWAAEVYFKPPENKGDTRSGLERLAAEVDEEVLIAILTGWRELTIQDVDGVDPVSLGKMELSGRRFYSEYAAIAGLERLRREDAPIVGSQLPLTLALVVLRTVWFTGSKDVREHLEAWAWERLNVDPEAGASALVAFWETVLTGGGANSSIWQRGAQPEGGAAAARAVTVMLERHPGMFVEPLRTLLAAAGKLLDRPSRSRLAAAALADPAVTGKQRAIWSLVAFAADPKGQQDRLTGHAEEDFLDLFDTISGTGLLDTQSLGDATERVALAAAVFAAISPLAQPYVEIGRGRGRQDHRLSDAANGMLKRLGAAAEPVAGDAIRALRTRIFAYPAWDAALRHAAEQQARTHRDQVYSPPEAASVAETLAGRAPVNAADLRAILVDEMRRFGRSLREDHESPWLDYWNTDGAGQPLDPKVENAARNTTLTKLKAALRPYGIATTLAEVQRRDGTRVDLYLAAHGGRNLPIEAKRHYHPDLWSTAEGQLQIYTTSEGATGLGMLLVFWFGADWTSTPRRTDGKKPKSAAELEDLLAADLPEDVRKTTDVIVLDVSRPGGGLSRTAFAAGNKLKAVQSAKAATTASTGIGLPSSAKNAARQRKAREGVRS
jgi:hypothetical protein